MRERDLLTKYNGTLANDITDRNKTYGREQYHEFFYVFDNAEDYTKWRKECESKIEYAFYDGLRLYKQEDVNKICDLREQGRRDEIRY
jgi:hypothetical protein